MKELLENRYKFSQIIALAATVAIIIGFVLNFMESDVVATIGGVLIVGGIIAGFVAVPFPFSLVAVPCTFIFAIMVFILLPIIPVRKAYTESLYK